MRDYWPKPKICRDDTKKSISMGLADIQGILLGLFGLLLFATIVLVIEVVYSHMDFRIRDILKLYTKHSSSNQRHVHPQK